MTNDNGASAGSSDAVAHRSRRSHSTVQFAQRLKDKWWECKKSGNVVNYDLNCMYKLLDGEYNLSVQLNVERGTLRRKPMRFQSIVQPFNHHRWNFCKLKPEEMMFYLRCLDKPYGDDPLDTHTICVNASPIESGHVLVVPSLSKKLPQIMNETGIRIATDLMLLVEDERFHVLYNSLLGQASVNHLHLHGLTWPYESDLVHRRFEPLAGKCFIARRPTWFIHTFCYQLRTADEVDQFVKDVWHTINFLTRRNIAHNVFFTRAPPLRTDGPVRLEQPYGSPSLVTVYIFPRQCHTGAKPMNNFNPAALELAGCLMAYGIKFFDKASEQNCVRIFDEDAALDDHLFEQLCEQLADRLVGREAWASQVDVPALSLSCDSSEYELTELEELKDAFHAVTLPLPHARPLKHHHSFSFAKPSPHEDDDPLAGAIRRRSHTTESALPCSRIDEGQTQ